VVVEDIATTHDLVGELGEVAGGRLDRGVAEPELVREHGLRSS